MKVLLAAVNAKYIHSNLAVHSLKAYARTYTEEIEVAEYTINQTFDAILQDIYRRKPDLLGISCYLWNIEYVGQLLRELPKILPDTKIWLGGPEVSYDAKAVLEQYPKVEGVMCGEGEETFAELLRVYHEEKGALCSGVKRDELFSDIPGIAYRNKDKAVIQNDFRPVIDLSTIPFVYDHIEDFENRIIYYESSRGCPFSCSYCLSSIDKCLRFREIELVKKELQFFIDKKVPQVKFVDRTFNCRHDRAPYEVLSTKWLTYAEVIRLKQIEEMVEVYYNSGQFCCTMAALEQEFASPFCMYECLAAYYDEKNAFAVSHSRIGRYEILYDFIVKTCKERSEQYMEMLTLDMYLRDNVKKRPEFLRESGVSSDEAAAFYKKEEKERTYLKAYEGYDRRQMRKMTHLERIDGKTVLFDYKNRDPLTGNAAIYYLSE